MFNGRRSASRYRPVAAQLAVPVALGLLIGGVLAYQAGSSNDAVIPPPLGAVASPTPSFVNPSAQHIAVLPTPTFLKPSASPATPAPATTTANPSGR